MSAKISGAELKTGMTIKANGRIYIVSDIEEADWIGARLAELKTSSGEYVTINLFEESEYELRNDRMVRVRASDVALLLTSACSYGANAAGLAEAVARLTEAAK